MLIGILCFIPFLKLENDFLVNNKESAVEIVFFVFMPYLIIILSYHCVFAVFPNALKGYNLFEFSDMSGSVKLTFFVVVFWLCLRLKVRLLRNAPSQFLVKFTLDDMVFFKKSLALYELFL